MSYTDQYEYQQSHLVDEEFKALDAAKAIDKPRLFITFCHKVIALKESKKMPLRDASYSITGTMFIKDLNDPLFEKIVQLAGELELPEEFINGNPERLWNDLIELINEYAEHVNK